MVAVIDPATSWSAKWQHLRKSAPGCYALSVEVGAQGRVRRCRGGGGGGAHRGGGAAAPPPPPPPTHHLRPAAHALPPGPPALQTDLPQHIEDLLDDKGIKLRRPG